MASNPLNRATKVVFLVAALFYGVFILRTSFDIGGTRYFVLFEDAMISMRYARHLAEGHGLVWNIGEAPIEGFTNLLWTLWMSLAHALHMSESKISLFIMLTGAFVMLGNGLMMAKIARIVSSSPWLPLFAATAVLFDYPLVFWTLRGMEVGALSFLIYTLLWLTLENEREFSIGRTVAMSIVAAMALLLRSDSVVPVFLIGLYGLASVSKRIPFVIIMAIFPGAALAGQMLFRRQYFHESLPNTYYLKLYGIPLVARVKRGLFVALEVLTNHLAIPISIVLAALPNLNVLAIRDQRTRRVVLFAALFSAQIAYATYVGGDAWEWMLYANRYMCIGMGALVLLVGLTLETLLATTPKTLDTFVGRLGYALMGIGLLLTAQNEFARMIPEEGIAATRVFSKTLRAAGGGIFLLGAIVRLRDMRLGIPEAFGFFRVSLANPKTRALAAIGLCALVWFPSHALPLGRWAAQNAAQYKDEVRYTRLGLLIRATTSDTTRLAVAAAGATPYFARRPTEDLLGKNDRVVARLSPRGVFSPGHDKWDYDYSLRQRKSDLIVELVDKSETDERFIKSLGFEELENGMRLRAEAPGVKRELIGLDMDTTPPLVDALERASFVLPIGTTGVDIAVLLVLLSAIGFIYTRAQRAADTGTETIDTPALTQSAESLESIEAAKRGAEARQITTLDGMRGLAVLAVLMFHFAWTFPETTPVAKRIHEFLWSGWIGVDMFFVLSGYLITRGLVAPSTRVVGSRLKMFWMRRVLRIFPVYYLMLIVGTIVCVAIGAWIPSWHYWLYMQNYKLAFDPEPLRWTAHFWSLAIEEQFYFVWPLVAVLVPRRKLVWVSLALAGLCILLRAGLTFKLGAYLPGEEAQKFVYRATFTRADGLLLGAFAATVQREWMHPVARVWRRLRVPLFVLTGLMILGLYKMCGGLNDYDRRIVVIGYATMALFFAVSVSLCADGLVSERVRAFLSSKLLVACGKVSYGMYLFHWVLVVYLVPKLEKVQPDMDTTTQMGLVSGVIVGGTLASYALAWVSFRFFEEPFLKLKAKFHD